MKSILECIYESKGFSFVLIEEVNGNKIKTYTVTTDYANVDEFANNVAKDKDVANSIKTWFNLGLQYSGYDNFNDDFKKFLDNVKLSKDNFYGIMPINNLKVKPNGTYKFD